MRRMIPWFIAAALASIPVARACSIDYLIWGIRTKPADPLFRFVRNGKAGYIDLSGNIVIQPILPADYNFFGEFHEGLLAVGGRQPYRYLDRSGAVAFQADVLLALDFSEGLAPALAPDLKVPPMWGFIDRTGHFAIPPRYASVDAFSEGLARVSASGEVEGTGYIDGDGRVVIPLLLSYGSSFHEGRAAAIVDGPCVVTGGGSCFGAEFRPTKQPATYDCRYALIDRSGKPVSGLRFDNAKDFAEGLAPVRLGSVWGYVDRSGRIAIAPEFDSAEPFSEGLAAVVQNGKTGFVNHSGAFVIPPQFESADSFSDGRAVVSKSNGDGTWSDRYIDRTGKAAFPGRFAAATSFTYGLAHVELSARSKTFAWINTSGKPVFTYDAR
jgi:hypothetical protein